MALSISGSGMIPVSAPFLLGPWFKDTEVFSGAEGIAVDTLVRTLSRLGDAHFRGHDGLALS